ncbi:MAG: HAD family hydrolase [Clostridia bacterium]|nr:HAD family hydrolase [Clostridia bacterium]
MIKCCIFDLDGTVLNTLDTIRYHLNKTLLCHGLPEVSGDECRRFVGNGARRLLERALSKSGVTDSATVDKVLGDYLISYDAEPYVNTSVFEGIGELMTKLRDRGIRLALLSNKQHSATLAVAEKFFPGVFDAVQGGTDGIPLKPDPTSATALLDEMGICPSELAFIGDSEVDIETAKNLGAALAIGVSWGFRSAEELTLAGADVLATDADEIFREVTKHA